MSDKPVIKEWTPEDASGSGEPDESNEPALPTRTKTVRKQDRTTSTLLVIAALVAVGGLCFAGGRMTAPTTAGSGGDGAGANGAGNGAPNFNGEGGGFPGGREMPSLAPGQTLNPGQFGPGGGGQQPGGGGGANGGSTITGTVQSFDGTTMTVKLANGSTISVTVTGTTTYAAEVQASAGAVTTGSTVIIQLDTSALGTPGPAASGAGTTGQKLQAKSVIVQSK